MSLKIKKENGIYTLFGTLNATSSKSLIKHIDLLLDYENEVGLDIDKLKSIDESGAATLKSITLRTDKRVYVSSNGFNYIYDGYNYQTV